MRYDIGSASNAIYAQIFKTLVIIKKTFAMNKTELIKELSENYHLFADYINSLTSEMFNARFELKWNAGKDLDHMVKSVQPLAMILNSKITIIENFGTINRPTLSYTELTDKYINALKNGGIARGKFIPENEIQADKKKLLIKDLLDQINLIVKSLTNYTENELDSLVLPHPLLGELTIREMLYFTIYHVKHHTENIKRNIDGITAAHTI